MTEKTFAIIKPDAVASGKSGNIIDIIELNKFNILRLKKLKITKEEATKFYEIHKEKPFFGELVDNITAGPAIIMVLEQENAIKNWRDLMGATNPASAAPGTLRKMFAQSIGKNAVHGSDAPETAKKEIAQFFTDL